MPGVRRRSASCPHCALPAAADLPDAGTTATRIEDFALQAFVFLVVFLVATFVLTAFYYNIVVLEDYILALFWASICSLPLFQIKMQIIGLMEYAHDWWWCSPYRVLEVGEDKKLRLQRRRTSSNARAGVGSRRPSLASTVEALGGDHDVREDLMLPEDTTIEEVKELLKKHKDLQAMVKHHADDPPEQDRVLAIRRCSRGLGTFHPYQGILDILCRDVPWIWRQMRALVRLLLIPLWRLLLSVEEEGSGPYFGLLFRACLLHICTRFLGLPWLFWISKLTLKFGCVIVAVRCLLTLLVYLGPRIALLFPDTVGFLFSAMPTVSQSSSSTKLAQNLRSSAETAVDRVIVLCLDNCHMILSILIIVISMLFTYRLCTFVAICLREEAFLIYRTLLDVLHPNPVFQMVWSKLTHLAQAARKAPFPAAGAVVGSDATEANELWSMGQALVEFWMPEYKDWFEKEGANLGMLKYVIFDMWRMEEGGPSAVNTTAPNFGFLDALASRTFTFSAPPPRRAPWVKEVSEECAKVVAMGGTCEVPGAEPWNVRLQSTTAFLRSLLQGNISDAFSMWQSVFQEMQEATQLMGDGSGEGGEGNNKFLDGAYIGGTWLASLLMHLFMLGLCVMSSASSMLGQTIVFFTALFYLLAAKSSCTQLVDEVLTVIDRSKKMYSISDLVLRAVLFSALKMSAFHALFTWLVYSWSAVPLVVVPTVLSALVALVPVVSPVWSVSIWAAVYLLWVQKDGLAAVFVFGVNLGVWWQVPTVIYAEIPESNAWITGLSVVFGISKFGLVGVVLGPAIASVPLICFNLLKVFNERREKAISAEQAVSRTESDAHSVGESGKRDRKQSVWNIHEKFQDDIRSPMRSELVIDRDASPSSSPRRTRSQTTPAPRSSPLLRKTSRVRIRSRMAEAELESHRQANSEEEEAEEESEEESEGWSPNSPQQEAEEEEDDGKAKPRSTRGEQSRRVAKSRRLRRKYRCLRENSVRNLVDVSVKKRAQEVERRASSRGLLKVADGGCLRFHVPTSASFCAAQASTTGASSSGCPGPQPDAALLMQHAVAG